MCRADLHANLRLAKTTSRGLMKLRFFESRGQLPCFWSPHNRLLMGWLTQHPLRLSRLQFASSDVPICTTGFVNMGHDYQARRQLGNDLSNRSDAVSHCWCDDRRFRRCL